MLTKKGLSLLLVITLLLAVVLVPATVAGAKSTAEIAPTTDNSTAYGLASRIADGNILQAFNWKAKEITEP